MIFIDINGAGAAVRRQEILTCGMVGAVCSFRFSEEWDPLSKTAVFRQGDTVKDAVCVDNSAVIPWEVLRAPGAPLEIGVYGTNNDGTTVIPTVWAKTRPLYSGADPSGDASVEPTPGVWEQMAAKVAKKVDRVSGGVGNVVIFGEDGAIADSGAMPTAVVTVYYDTTGAYDSDNRALFVTLKDYSSKGVIFVANMIVDGRLHRALFKRESASVWKFVAMEISSGIYYTVSITRGEVTYERGFLYQDNEFDPKERLPASQPVVAKWVTDQIKNTAPVRGKDYYTEEDQAAIVDDVLKSLPKWEGGEY